MEREKFTLAVADRRSDHEQGPHRGQDRGPLLEHHRPCPGCFPRRRGGQRPSQRRQQTPRFRNQEQRVLSMQRARQAHENKKRPSKPLLLAWPRQRERHAFPPDWKTSRRAETRLYRRDASLDPLPAARDRRPSSIGRLFSMPGKFADATPRCSTIPEHGSALPRAFCTTRTKLLAPVARTENKIARQAPSTASFPANRRGRRHRALHRRDPGSRC